MSLLKELVHHYVNNDAILDDVDRHLDIVQNRLKIEEEIRVIQAKAKKEETKLRQQIVALQAMCEHPITKYFPDAAGGSDSETHCEICDARWRGNFSKPRKQRSLDKTD